MDYRPHDYHQTLAANDFTRGNLELTFKLLRQQHPSLALIIRNQLVVNRIRHQAEFIDDHLLLTLPQEIVAEIIGSLSDIGEVASHSQQWSREELITIRSILLDWLLYAQSFIDHLELLEPSKQRPYH